MKQFIYFCSIVCLSLLSNVDLQASHIVGGNLTYKCLGGQRYQITLTVRRDCFYGSDTVGFDKVARVYITDDKGKILKNIGDQGILKMNFNPDDTLNEVLKTECEVIGGDVCVHTTTYREIIELPLNETGYILLYQRCCRNMTLNNIVSPDSVGFTILSRITPTALRYCNSSPVFKDWPPIYVCGDRPILFDHGAVDAEGDSLAFSLCAPFDGGTPVNNSPTPPVPYKPVVFKPPFDVFNMMGGNVPLNIHPRTGLLTGQTNSLIAQYLIGVCVEEFRNGQLLSVIRRDFQYNVRICLTNPEANIESDTYKCNGDFTVNFSNKSFNAKKYTWFFDFPDLTIISRDSIPTHTYPKAGKYRVVLIAQRDQQCIDTSFKDIFLYDDTQLQADFDFGVNKCMDTIEFALRDKSFDSLLFIKKWDWQIDLKGKRYGSNQQNPIFFFTDSGMAQVQLIITSESGCQDTLVKNVLLKKINIDFESDVIPICIGETTHLLNSFDSTLMYRWSPDYRLSCNNCPKVIANPDTSTTYNLVVTDGLCTVLDTVHVMVSKLLAMQITTDTIACNDTVNLAVFGGVENKIEWATDPNFSNVFASGTFNTQVILNGNAIYYVRGRSPQNCPGADSISIRNERVIYSVGGNVKRWCELDTFPAFVLNNRPEHNLIFKWRPEARIISGQGQDTVYFMFDTCGKYALQFDIENQFKCNNGGDSLLVDIECKPKADFKITKNCDNTIVQFFNESDAGNYTWDFGDNNTSTEKNPVHKYDSTGRYTVKLFVKGFCSNEITKTFDVGLIVVELPDTIISCSGNPVHINPNPDLNYTYSWSPAQFLDDPTSPNPLATVPQTTVFTTRISDPFIPECFIDRSVAVFVTPDIELRAMNDTILCYTDSINLRATSHHNVSLSWRDEVGVLLGTGNDLGLRLPDSICLNVTGVDEWGCVDRDTMCIVPIHINTEMIGSKRLCPGARGYVEILNKGGNEFKYTWSPDSLGKIVSGRGTERIIVQPDDTTTYTVDYVDQYGCAFKDSFTVNISRFDPPLQAWADDDTIYLGETTQLHVLDGYKNYIWLNTEFLSCENCQHPFASPEETTFYTVQAENEDGCKEQTSVRIVVLRPKCDDTDVYVPNIFSPNQDKENDVFRVRSNFLDEVEMYIYDRWGEQVFETKSITNWWDGYYKGAIMDPDVYGYYLKVRCTDGQYFTKKGNITLIR